MAFFMRDLLRISKFWMTFASLFLYVIGCADSGNTNLQKAPLNAAMNNDVALLSHADKQGADLNAQYPERFNWTPLMAAIYFDNTNVIAYLLNRGVDVSKREAGGQTALMMAIAADDTNTGAMLVQKYPQVLRNGEDWPMVWSCVKVSKHPDIWRVILNPFQNTNDSPILEPSH